MKHQFTRRTEDGPENDNRRRKHRDRRAGFLGDLGVLRIEAVCGEKLVFQRHNSFAVAAESGDFLQVAVCLRQGHHWSVAVDRVTIGGKVPASTLRTLIQVACWAAHGRCWIGNRQTKHQG
jgi:hypothetical protein